MMLAGCEVIKENERLIPVPIAEDMRTHVLIEYTGFRCVNCPTAATMADELHHLYGNRLIVVAMHPASNPFTQGAYDYTCPEADECYLYMGGTASTSFPTGNIDLSPSNDQWFFEPVEWATRLQAATQSSYAPSLSLEATIDTLTRQIHCAVTTTSHVIMEARLAIWFTEDSIIGVQAMPNGSVNTNYCHRHMLRSAVNGQVFGKEVRLPAEPATFIVEDRLPDACEPKHCHAVALLLDKNDYHILQAYETKLDISSHAAALRER